MASRLRVVHILQSGWGGGVEQAASLARRAAERGADVDFVIPSGEHTHAAIGDAGIAVWHLPSGRSKRTRQLVQLVRRADLVHAHGARAATWVLPLLPTAASVVTFHGLHPLHKPARPGYRVAARILVQTITSAARAVICVSEADAAELGTFALGRRKVRVVPNAIPPIEPVTGEERARARLELGLADDELVVLLAVRLNDQKDPLTAIRAANSLDDEKIVLLVAGDGPLSTPVAAAATDRIRVLGFRANMRRLLAAADVVLNSARWEGMSLGLLEAMWAGRPIVYSSAPGNVETVGDAGIVFPVGDPNALRDALLRLRDPGERKRLAALARERVHARFDFETMISRTDSVYADVLGHQPW